MVGHGGVGGWGKAGRDGDGGGWGTAVGRHPAVTASRAAQAPGARIRGGGAQWNSG